MKKNIFTLHLFIVLFVGVLSIPTVAQTRADSGGFTLEDGFTLKTSEQQLPYSFTIKLDNKLNLNEMKDYFSNFNTEISTLEIDAEKRTAKISIELRAKPEWQLRDWNTFLERIHKQALTNSKL